MPPVYQIQMNFDWVVEASKDSVKDSKMGSSNPNSWQYEHPMFGSHIEPGVSTKRPWAKARQNWGTRWEADEEGWIQSVWKVFKDAMLKKEADDKGFEREVVMRKLLSMSIVYGGSQLIAIVCR